MHSSAGIGKSIVLEGLPPTFKDYVKEKTHICGRPKLQKHALYIFVPNRFVIRKRTRNSFQLIGIYNVERSALRIARVQLSYCFKYKTDNYRIVYVFQSSPPQYGIG